MTLLRRAVFLRSPYPQQNGATRTVTVSAVLSARNQTAVEYKENVSKHYADVAARYDELYGFTNDYIADFAVKHLKLKPDDRLTDIGAGTGAVTSLIWKKSGLTSPILCVDPSEEMLHIAETRSGVKSCLATADSFFDSPRLPKYNKVLFNGSAHLFPDALGTFRKAFEYLPEDGLLVLVTRSTYSTLPMWRALQEKLAPVKPDAFRRYLQGAGFKYSESVEVHATNMTKQEWYDKLRKRVFTALSEFSDEEIEDGIRELDREWFSDKNGEDIIEIRDSLGYFSATKH